MLLVFLGFLSETFFFEVLLWRLLAILDAASVLSLGHGESLLRSCSRDFIRDQRPLPAVLSLPVREQFLLDEPAATNDLSRL